MVVEFENIASKDARRITWPLSLSPIQQYENVNLSANTWEMNFSNKVHGDKYNQFPVLVVEDRTYNLRFTSQPPRDMRFQLQRTEKDDFSPEKWVIVKVFFPIKNSIRVNVKGQTIDPITILDQNAEDPLLGLTDVCGSNKFYYKDQTLDFVLNGDPDCLPRITVTNSIQLHVKFNMSIAKFFEMDGKTKFIDRVCTLLEIDDYSRVKIVGIYEGSVIIDSFVEEAVDVSENGTNLTNTTDGAMEMEELNNKLNQLNASGEFNATMVASGFGNLVVFNSDLYLVEEEESPEASSDSLGSVSLTNWLLIGLAAGGLILVLAIGVCYCCKKKGSVENELSPEQSEEKRIVKKQQMADSFHIIELE